MSEKQVVSRNVAIALGIVCIVLGIGLVGTILNFMSILSERDNTLQTSETQIQTLTNQKNHLQTCLDGNLTLLSTTMEERDGLQVYLDGNCTLLDAAIEEKNRLQNWLAGNITAYEYQIGTLEDQISGLNSQIDSLNNQIVTLETQIDDLENQVATLENQIDALENQIVTLETQIDALEAPKLIEVNLNADDNRPLFQTPYLHVYGEVCNVGTNTAYNCRLHVVAYQGSVVAIDTYILLGTIYGESWETVDENIYYTGSALTYWTVTLEWTS